MTTYMPCSCCMKRSITSIRETLSKVKDVTGCQSEMPIDASGSSSLHKFHQCSVRSIWNIELVTVCQNFHNVWPYILDDNNGSQDHCHDNWKCVIRIH